LAPVGQVRVVSGGNQEDVRYTSIAGSVLQGCTWPQGQLGPYPAGSAVAQIAPSWNVVVIRHDLKDDLTALTTPDPHDIGQGGVPSHFNWYTSSNGRKGT